MHDATFRAMGTAAHVTVDGGGPDDLVAAESLVRACERRWSRFLPASELCQLNRAAGAPVHLPVDTYDLVAAAIDCWTLTAGRFDPTVLPALEAAGYDASFERASRIAREVAPAPGCAGIVLDDELHAVTLPAGVALDLGGIAKGHTADLVADMLVERGVGGALVNLGGDVRARGTAPGGAWDVGIVDPFDPELDCAIVRIADGAVATSSTLRRRWRDRGRSLHHLIDPRTGRPSTSTLVAVTVVAESTAWAEVTAKAALLAGADEAPGVVAAAGATGLLVHDDGRVTRLAGLEVFA